MTNFSKHQRHASLIDLSSTPSTPFTSVSSLRSPDKTLHRTDTSESQYVAFPAIPESSRIHSFSSALNYVSTSLKPFKKPSISYPSAHLPGSSSAMGNGLKTAFGSSPYRPTRPSSSSADSPMKPASIDGLKRSRTTTASTVQLAISRKRSKSDLDPEAYRSWSNSQIALHSIRQPGTPSHKPCSQGSSASLNYLGSPGAPAIKKPRHSNDITPASLIRHKHRTHGSFSSVSGTLTREIKMPNPPASPSSPMRCKNNLRIDVHRTQSHRRTQSTEPETKNANNYGQPVRPTYLGGVGVYLNNYEEDEEEDEDGDCTIALGKSKFLPSSESNQNSSSNINLSRELSNDGWYNRLVLSPISSASSSVFSFFTSGSSEQASPITEHGSSCGDPQEREDVDIQKVAEYSVDSSISRSRHLPFRNWDI
ncbi:hypothetical protein BY996DRAFT_6410238 [Phakopsora pachyrhizi]|nr:hypothetical protein BY996DRAFT_6410238 [Phakopsora pachyrhizi]